MATQSVTLEITASITADMVRNDYGVDRSPVWYEADNVDVEEIEINGKSYGRKELIETFGEVGAKALMEIVCEAVDDDNWEQPEPDYDDRDYDDED
jgi:hypothetical protein